MIPTYSLSALKGARGPGYDTLPPDTEVYPSRKSGPPGGPGLVSF